VTPPRTTCPACEGGSLRALYRQAAIPSQSVILLDTVEEACNFSTGELTLTLCEDCGFLFNATFDRGLIDYAATTEESQHFSGTFNRFAKGLIDEIAALKPLAGRLTLEVGCGKGDFLMGLVHATGTRAIGVDPGYLPDRAAHMTHPDVTFRKEHFDPARITEVPDLIICRHTLEHIDDVLGFMSDVVSTTRGGSSTDIVFETPDVARVLSEGAFWDIYHEHCSYFTIGSHARLFRRVGLDVTQSYLGFGGQYIVQYARPGVGQPRPEEQDLDKILALAETFPACVAETRAYWADKVKSAHAAGKGVAIWGGGSKCVAFLAANGIGPEVTHVVDINPHKQGKYLPQTAHRVAPPISLKDAKPELVIVMNEIYLKEIAEELDAMQINPETVALK
jgi:hypothetical protein